MSSWNESRDAESGAEELESDESPSEPIDISLPPGHDGRW